MLLIKNADVYAPEHMGKKDILICGEHIEVMADRIENLPGPCKTLEADGMCLIPGLMDQHVHVTGGGGEGSFHTRTPEVELSELIRGGVTTVLGLLGTDGMTRSVENLYAKTAALLEEGVTAYMLTGAYGNPGPTITGEPDRDMVFIREVLGLTKPLNPKSPSANTEAAYIQAVKFQGGTVKLARDTKEIAPSGWFGPLDPKDSSAELGQEALDLSVGFIRNFLEEMKTFKL